MIHLDTSLLVDRLREVDRAEAGPATRFLGQHEDEELVVSVHVLCELQGGAALARNPHREQEKLEQVCSAVRVAYPDARFAQSYGHLAAALQQRGEQIGTMDLLIATAAVLDEAPLVTRNRKEFSRISELTILDY